MGQWIVPGRKLVRRLQQPHGQEVTVRRRTVEAESERDNWKRDVF